jgi:formylglycine-generating enzyme required for sulfatase activity
MTSIYRIVLPIPLFLIGLTSFARESKKAMPDRIEVMEIELIKVNPVKFTMGIRDLHTSIEPYDGLRKVEITKPFYLAVNEITQASWNQKMDKNPSRFKDAKRPVEGVTWKQSMAFCQSLNDEIRKSGHIPKGMIFRLPSEAEWECAARAGTKSLYFFGDKPDSITDYAWISENSEAQTHAVKRKKANPWGFHDLYGNVREWCLDGYGKRPEQNLVDPLLEWRNMDKVNRGGSWDSCEDCCKTGRRSNFGKDYHSSDVGFRLALGFKLEGM